ncbi:MAG TPA: efflux RND transporter periplasmic adaptor subunit [Rhizomicrobium sp.]|nr:efflux RND transporter periplasmic adaptor subunit [Rhizomicrobium sp.]
MFKQIGSALSAMYDRVMPAFWLRLKPRYQWAGGIALLVAVWIATGIFGGSAAKPDTGTSTNFDVSRVRVSMLTASLRNATITVRGKTQALHAVDVRAEVEGIVQKIHFDKGDKVKTGDVLCEIKLDDRGAKVAQAQAMVAQTLKELEVARDLYAQGFRSKTQLAQAEAAYAQARAGLSTVNVALDNTRIRAPFDGIVDDRYVNVGDYMRAGDKCELLIAPQPFLAVGTVSEEEVGQIEIGDPATAVLVTGETVQGKVRFVADRADPTTRTFRVEVELPNPDAKLRDGVSADVHIPVRQVKAQHISPGILVLDDSGKVGVRAVVNSVVQFMPVQILSDGPDGMWVAGLPEHVNVITVGQEFVSNGQHVNAIAGQSS